MSLINKQSGWIESIGQGAYKLKGQEVQWTGALYTLQTYLKQPLHVGGITALEWSGLSHFLNMGNRSVFLYGVGKQNLPQWFRHIIDPLDVTVQEARSLTGPEKFYNNRGFGDYEVSYSVPEQAYLELLFSVPHRVSFIEARQIAENLNLLRASVLQTLLEQSRNIKVNRLALYMGEYHAHEWLEKLDIESINQGRGKRVIYAGGIFNEKYQITVAPAADEKPYV
ncbi:MAG: type IV toxin-antitoxin system AbiEi family antitoxin [Spirochaetia bacterium]|nr:type IV toxin-antitoxin system AbiEi family antitoxin [Spirochaetia bacterium]